MNDERKDDRLDEQLQEAARDYNAPPQTPREAMWAGIETRRRKRRDRDRLVRLPWWQNRKLIWPTAAAATLIIGIAVGRMTISPQGQQTVVESDAGIREGSGTPETPGSDPQGSSLYQFAAAPVLSRVELLLSQYRVGETAGTNGDNFSARAARLLTETRLLLDSPAGDDRKMRHLLSDLELVLAQLVRATADAQNDDQEWITESMQRRSLLPRLRAQLPAVSPRAHL